MDILIHSFSGLAVGTVVSSYTKNKLTSKFKCIFYSGFGAALPDLDAISLWSKFDSTLGQFFHLSRSGNEIYFDKLWYSHHAILHSIFAGFTFLLFFFVCHCLVKKTMYKKDFAVTFHQYKFFHLGFIASYIIHLFEDMPTPASYWGGVNLWWPNKNYVGGFGEIWWWNNYDIFLIVFSVFLINMALHLIGTFFSSRTSKLTTIVFLIGLGLSIFQIRNRHYDYSYSGHNKRFEEFENNSKKEQREILGVKLFSYMEKLDNKLPINF